MGSGFCAALALFLTRWPTDSVLETGWTRGLVLLIAVLLGSGLIWRCRESQGSWRQPIFQLAFVVRLLVFGMVATPNFFMVLMLRNQLGWTVAQAALLCMALSGAMLLGISLSHRICQKFSFSSLLRAGLCAMALSFLGWTLALEQASSGGMALSNSMLGFAIGLLVPAVTTAGMRAAPPRHAVQASAWLILADSLGPMLGLAFQGGLFLTLNPLLERSNFMDGLQIVYLSSAFVLMLAALVCGRWTIKQATIPEDT